MPVLWYWASVEKMNQPSILRIGNAISSLHVYNETDSWQLAAVPVRTAWIMHIAFRRALRYTSCVVPFILSSVFIEKGLTQDPPHWRAWSDPGELPGKGIGWISVSPNGRIWATSDLGADFAASWFDGYEAGSLPKVGDFSLVREGSSGQIWALNYDLIGENVVNVSQYKYESSLNDGKWVQYDIQDLQSHGVLPRSLSKWMNFVPGGRDRLLILLLDRLVEFDAATENPTILKTAEETRFRTFIHLAEALDEGLWITADKGLARVGGDGAGGLPTNGSVRWQDFVCPEELGLQDFAYPVPVQRGEILCTASSIWNERRVLVRFNGETWKIVHSAGEEDAIMGWTGVDDIVWVLKAESFSPFLVPSRYTDRVRLREWISPSLSWLLNETERRVDRRKTLAGRIDQVVVESNGVFWLGTSRGPARHAPPTWRSLPGCPDIEEAVYAAHEDREGRLWFSATDVLLCLENGQWKSYKLPTGKAFPIHTVQSLCSIQDGRIALVTRDGCLLTLKPGSEDKEFHSIVHPGGRVFFAIVPRADGRLWVVTTDPLRSEGCIEIFDGKHFETILGEREGLQVGIPPQRLLETRDGELWLAKWDGVGRYANGEYQKFASGDGCLSGHFYSLMETEDGRIWAGGENKIVEFNDKAWRIVSDVGLGNVNNMLRRRDGSLWAATQTGIHRYVEGSWVANTDEDGLPTQHGYILFEDSQGRLWAGMSSCLALYHPEADPDPPETDIPIEKNLAEASPDGDVRLLYSGIDRWKYTQTERLLYSHRFDDGPWSQFMSDTVASATGLSPGAHGFEVRAVDRNWNVDPTPASFEFTVLLPWYKEPAFVAIAGIGSVIILLLAGYSISRYVHMERLVTRRTEAMRKAYIQLQSLASQISFVEERERRKIATDLHDRIGHGLAACRMLLTATQKNTRDQETAAQLDQAKDLLAQTIEDTRSLTFEISPPILYSIGLEAALEWLVEQFAKQYNVTFFFHDDKQAKPVGEDVRGILFRAVRELLFNVVKHARAKSARVSIKRSDGNVQIDVEDDGIGFDEAEATHGRSNQYCLLNIRERLEYLGGTFVHHPTSADGTHISLTLPLSARVIG